MKIFFPTKKHENFYANHSAISMIVETKHFMQKIERYLGSTRELTLVVGA